DERPRNSECAEVSVSQQPHRLAKGRSRRRRRSWATVADEENEDCESENRKQERDHEDCVIRLRCCLEYEEGNNGTDECAQGVERAVDAKRAAQALWRRAQ